MDSSRLDRTHLLLWVRTGAADVDDGRGGVHRITAGSAMWVPAGAPGRVTTRPGSVAFPFWIPPAHAPTAPGEPVQFAVPACWQDWLILHFTHGATGLAISGYAPRALPELLGIVGSGQRRTARSWTPGDEPPLPTAPGAASVARSLRAQPALGHSIEQWAVEAACSVSTLRRGFAATGLTFARWRTLVRLAAGSDALAAGLDVEQSAAHAGFSSRHGFTRAFGEHYGLTPREHATAATAGPRSAPHRVAVADGLGTLARALAAGRRLSDDPADVPAIPATHLGSHTNSVHVLTWTYRGAADLRIGDIVHRRRTGDAIWIPAGVEHVNENLPGSLSLAVADLTTVDATITTPLRSHFPPSWDDYLLHRAVASRTMLRPEGFDPTTAADLFVDGLVRPVRSVRVPPGPAATTRLGRQSGSDVRRSRHAARMRLAGELLAEGAGSGDVARRLGYAHARSFSRAFSRFHGASPRQFKHEVARLSR